MKKILLLAVSGLALLAAGASAQSRLLTLDDIYDPDRKVDFTGTPPTGLTWIDDTHYLWPKTDARDRSPEATTERATEILKVEAVTGRTDAFFDAARVESALAALEGVTREEARRLAHRRSYTMNEGRTAIVLEAGGDLYLVDLTTLRARRLTRAAGKEEEATFSPDGKRVAFVRDHNLYVVDTEGQKETALTSDGSPDLLNGKLDWVYQEEIYGRGTFRAYWWSPDSSRLAFLQLNEKKVPRYTLVDDIPYRPKVETYPYPKAGDANPDVRLAMVEVSGAAPQWVATPEPPADILIVDVSWTPDSRRVAYQVQDREQTWLELRLAEAGGGPAKTIVRETTPAWVEPNGSPRWLKDGSFLWLSEGSGWKHLYRHRADGSRIGPVTSGPWEVRTLHGIDEKTGWIYFSGTERSHVGLDVYRIRLDGSRLTRLSTAPGTHTATFSPSFALYLDSWSDIVTPQQVRVHRADGTEARVAHAGRVPALAEYRLARPELLQVKTRDGFVMEAFLLKPPDFDPARRYPVYQYTYAGPHAPQVRDSWGGTGYMYHQLLAQKGIVVWICDNRTASGKGAQSTWPGYKRLGETELQDIEDGLGWLKSQPWVDGSRVAINGWSYGGFMVSYALTHSRSFSMGIAGGTVSDWRDYDTVYTERYMLTPERNPEGYQKSSPRFAARDLHGRLLLLHGGIDDNVHPQNTQQLAYELQKAGQPFRMMLYPKSRHGVSEGHLVKHLRSTMLDFTLENLRPGETALPAHDATATSPASAHP